MLATLNMATPWPRTDTRALQWLTSWCRERTEGGGGGLAATTVTEPPLLGLVTALLKGGILAASPWSLSRCAGNLHFIYKVNVYLYRL